MNNINFKAKDNFPLSSDTMDMMQKMIDATAEMALLGGSNYILSGCVNDGSGNISSGVVVIGGEILPFEAGVLKTKITIVQTSKTLDAFGVEYPEAYIYRAAKFSDIGEYIWADFKQVLTNQQLQQRIEAIKGDDPGIIKMWSGQIVKIPSDYHLCDGSILSISDYPKLFDNLGTAFGGDGINSFALPDIRGRFVVGYNSSDSDYNAVSKDKVGGEKKVTLSVDEIPAHKHAYTDDTNAAGKFSQIEPGFPQSIGGINPARSSAEDSGSGTVYNTQTVGGGLAHENRPPYFVLAYIIKLK